MWWKNSKYTAPFTSAEYNQLLLELETEMIIQREHEETSQN